MLFFPRLRGCGPASPVCESRDGGEGARGGGDGDEAWKAALPPAPAAPGTMATGSVGTMPGGAELLGLQDTSTTASATPGPAPPGLWENAWLVGGVAPNLGKVPPPGPAPTHPGFWGRARPGLCRQHRQGHRRGSTGRYRAAQVPGPPLALVSLFLHPPPTPPPTPPIPTPPPACPPPRAPLIISVITRQPPCPNAGMCEANRARLFGAWERAEGARRGRGGRRPPPPARAAQTRL